MEARHWLTQAWEDFEMQKREARIVAVALLAAMLLHPGSLAGKEKKKKKKIKPEELVALHLESIGAPQARAARKSSIAKGIGEFKVLVGRERFLRGEADLVSEGAKMRSALLFAVSDYPGEVVAFDGKKSDVAQLLPGQRSEIGRFLYQYEEILKEGLLGGVLSTAWPFLYMEERKLKLKYRGMRKFGDHQMHELEYRHKRGGSVVKARLYFEPQTYRHFSTVYTVKVPAPMVAAGVGTSPAGRAAESSRQSETRYTLEEYFANFRQIGGLTLPSFWKVRLSVVGPGAQVGLFTAANLDRTVLEWNVSFESIRFNAPIDAQAFRPKIQ